MFPMRADCICLQNTISNKCLGEEEFFSMKHQLFSAMKLQLFSASVFPCAHLLIILVNLRLAFLKKEDCFRLSCPRHWPLILNFGTDRLLVGALLLFPESSGIYLLNVKTFMQNKRHIALGDNLNGFDIGEGCWTSNLKSATDSSIQCTSFAFNENCITPTCSTAFHLILLLFPHTSFFLLSTHWGLLWCCFWLQKF